MVVASRLPEQSPTATPALVPIFWSYAGMLSKPSYVSERQSPRSATMYSRYAMKYTKYRGGS